MLMVSAQRSRLVRQAVQVPVWALSTLLEQGVEVWLLIFRLTSFFISMAALARLSVAVQLRPLQVAMPQVSTA